MARHTFATVALANRISMESVVKMLGHTDSGQQNIHEDFGPDRFRRNERDKKQILDPTKAEGQTDHI